MPPTNRYQDKRLRANQSSVERKAPASFRKDAPSSLCRRLASAATLGDAVNQRFKGGLAAGERANKEKAPHLRGAFFKHSSWER
jgi:hypothetical protein